MTAPPAPVYLARVEELIRALPAGAEFVNADMHARMRAAGWPDLSEPRLFGPFLLGLQKAGVISKVGLRATTARSHGGVATVWRRAEEGEE
ncbi:hypothetical protein IU449_27025 [Nocardia higoensis]|uniref:Uncharacterized protein n=1 Tax=Nocardia higoensis TaxID=228599 RepID=A0ABS0DM76_9NOCA|nr:hypothetical protein [Nocardia higoensis]MBF6358154.1 hypothetical protein [Nocardia higoensis]